MSEAPQSATETPDRLEGGTYDIIRSRLSKQGEELRARLRQLNTARKEVFGSIETELISNERISTQNKCRAGDITAIGDFCLFGYNVFIGLRSTTELKDVFSLYRFKDHSFQEHPLEELLGDEQFKIDFINLYRYYKNTHFAKFARIDNFLFMVFQVSDKPDDIKTFKWLIKDERISYVDNRSDHEYSYPNQYQFRWERVTRDMHRPGRHPHVSILDRVFVETVGGDLTIKVEDNTQDGKGIYAEDVEFKDQTLDDAEYWFANLGNLIALKIKPYQEDPRFFIFNDKMQSVRRIDALADSGVLLPDQQGLIFSNGYYLQTGEYKLFDQNRRNKKFERQIQSPNGEDHLYVFYNAAEGRYVLMSYNVIEQTVATPILCNGFTLFPDGELVYFREEPEETKHHRLQIWRTPFMAGELLPSEHQDTYLYKVGNKDIVRAMAECQELLVLLSKDDSYSDLYFDIMQRASDINDAYYWVDNKAAFEVAEPLRQIRDTAGAAIEEFEKVKRIRENTKAEIEAVEKQAQELFKRILHHSFDNVEHYVQELSDLRILRGNIISLRDLRYTNEALIEELEKQAVEKSDELSQSCIDFLLKDDALQPYVEKIERRQSDVGDVSSAAQAKDLEENIDGIGEELKLLIEIVNNLKIEDTTKSTQIIDNISGMYSQLNQLKAALKRKQKELMGTEAVAEFSAQLKLLDQSIINYLDLADTPEKCDEYLTRLMVQLEELEGRFVDFEEFIEQITEKREEVYSAFESRKLQLVEARNRRATALQNAAERILKGIKNRLGSFKEVPAINGFFASDLMIEKVRDIIEQLNELDDNVKADDIQSQLKTIKEDAIRQLRDRQDLFVGGDKVIKLGKHHFSVNTQPLDLSIIQREEGLFYHITGTNFFEQMEEERLEETRTVWNQALVSENKEVYRAEYLAFRAFEQLEKENKHLISDEVLPFVQQFAANRYQEGYDKGIHDEDAAKILTELLRLSRSIDLLYFPALERSCAALYWERFIDEAAKKRLHEQLKSAGLILQVFPDTREFDYLLEELEQGVRQFLEQSRLFPVPLAGKSAAYLFAELTRQDRFIISQEAADARRAFLEMLQTQHHVKRFEDSLKGLAHLPIEQYRLAHQWMRAFLDNRNAEEWKSFLPEAARLLLLSELEPSLVIDVTMRVELSGMHGSHGVLDSDKYLLDYNRYMQKMEHYALTTVPLFELYSRLKKELSASYREELRLDEFKPRVLSSFVRNKLIDTVYLPIFGDNLAKQIGTVGENTRTDRMGMLLLISPPGYGKTTLMEYVASRLGLIFVKINGPAIGHRVISLDPSEANNAAAAKELQRLNLALEMGDNIMLYLDDIQHCNPEFLQKFISLTDGQRKIEGVYKGKTKTYDMRGKKVCVVMAGNPYTESGDKFQIPDMLANRADIYNLGDILGDTKDVFELSYIENSLTSNAVLQKLASKSMKDVYAIVKYAQTGSQEGLDFESNHSSEELNEYLNVMKKMLRVRDVLLKVNLEYIDSAAKEEDYRTEPAFKLQGSYRNMNKLAEKIEAVMNEQELETLILSHYEGEAQTLTTGAEANMLKLKQLMGVQTEAEAQRWAEIIQAFNKNKTLRGMDAENPMVQVVAQLSSFSDGLVEIRRVLEEGLERAGSKKSGGGLRF